MKRESSGVTAVLLAEFQEAAAEMGRYQAANDADRDEFEVALAHLDSAYAGLLDRREVQALHALLVNEDPYVQLYAAKMLLRTDEESAIRVLENLRAREGPRNIALNADMFLSHWRKGWLFPRA